MELITNYKSTAVRKKANMVWLLRNHFLKLLILVVLSTGITCSAQELLWTCSSSNDNETTYFPNIPIDGSSLASSVRGSPYLSNLYVYRFQPMINESCNRKTFVEFCFEDTGNISKVEMTIFLAKISNAAPDGTSLAGRVLNRISINAMVDCNQELRNDHHVCCHSESIDVPLSTEMNAFAILFPNQTLLEYNNSQSQVETFITFTNTIAIANQLTLNASGRYMNLSLRFLRFTVESSITITDLPSSETSQSSEATDSPAPSASVDHTIATLLPTIIGLVIIVLVIAVAIFAIKWQKEKRKKLSINELLSAREGLNNANYDDRVFFTTTETSRYHDYAVASGELDSGEHVNIARAATYEKPPMSLQKNGINEDSEEIYVDPACDERALICQFSQFKMNICSKDEISLKASLGSGQFGTVHKGEWVSSSGGDKIEVAVKTLKEGAGEEDKVKFLQEAAIMGQFSHPNVVKLYGVITEGEPIMLILELLAEGDLQKVLLGIDPHTINADFPHTLLSYCRQVASGMSYLSSKLFIHRDLAARNILMSEDGACKIADFGMSRDLADADYYRSHGGKIPVKWTAPEAIHYKKYSAASDVWSFGCVMYEIWSLGHKPFEKYTNVEYIKVIDKGARLAPPPGCPRIIYKLMIDCWHPDSSGRPDFVLVVQQLSLPDTKLLKWSEEDKTTDPEAATLGAGLDKAVNLYKDLQKQYI